MPDELAEKVAVVGQIAMPEEGLSHTLKLKAILNVEGNFLPNMDYRTYFKSVIYALAATAVII